MRAQSLTLGLTIACVRKTNRGPLVVKPRPFSCLPQIVQGKTVTTPAEAAVNAANTAAGDTVEAAAPAPRKWHNVRVFISSTFKVLL